MTIAELGVDDADVELFDPPPETRTFSAGDVLRLLVGLVLIAIGWVLATYGQSTIEGLESDLVRVIAHLPEPVENASISVTQFLTSAAPTIVFVYLLFRRRFRLALLLLLTSTIASLVMIGVDSLVLDDNLQAIIQAQVTDSSNQTFPTSSTIASTVAIVTVAGPFLSRRWRRALWIAVGALFLLRLIAGEAPALDLLAVMGVGTVVGAAILLVFGSPVAEPRPSEMLAALRHAGFDPRAIRRPEQHGDRRIYELDDRSRGRFDVSLRTPDERDAALMERTWRRIRLRTSEVGETFSTLKRRVEHEMLILTLTHQAGVRAPEAVRLGTTEGGSAFLVIRHENLEPLDDADLDDDAALVDLWAQIAALHEAGLAHGQLSRESLRRDDEGHVWLTGFDRAEIAPTDRHLARDVAQLLVETALVVGPERATADAVAGMGADGVAPALRMLQPLALPRATRARAKAVDGLLDDLREQVNTATGEPGLELEDLERLKPRTVLVVVASTFAFYSLLPQFANLGDTVDSFSEAEPLWILGVVVASAFTYFFAAISFQGAVAERIPFAPNLRAQVASSFAGLVGPAGAGGFALTARFLERVGVGRAEAAASVAVNAIGGFAVHATLLVGFIVWTGRSGLGDFSLPSASTLLIIFTVVFVVLGAVLAIGPIRRRVVSVALDAVRSGAGQVASVFSNPVRVLGLFGGSAGLSLTYVVAMICAVEAFGGGVGVPQIGAAYLAAVAIATLAPTPGGLGALESALIAGLTGFGMAAPEAVSATLTFRLGTFWLPILPGWLSAGWMQRNDEL